MAGNGDEEGLPRAASSTSGAAARVRARGDPLLIVCRCFSFITALTAILCICVNVLSAVRSFKDGSDVRNITAFYFILFYSLPFQVWSWCLMFVWRSVGFRWDFSVLCCCDCVICGCCWDGVGIHHEVLEGLFLYLFFTICFSTVELYAML